MADNLKFVLKRGEVGKVLTATLKDAGGAVNLTGKTVVMSARKSVGGTLVITDAACVVTGALTGTVTYTFDSTTANIAKNDDGYYLEFKSTGGGKTDFFPNNKAAEKAYGRLIVRESLD